MEKMQIRDSTTTVGVVLGQHEDKNLDVIYYVTKNLTPSEINYMLTEKEFSVDIYTIKNFHHYTTGYPTFVNIYHSTIKYLMNKPITPRWIKIWLLLLEEYDITIVAKPRKENVVADFLSRLNIDNEDIPIEDIFPDERIFFISTHTPWYAYVANYLAASKVPHYLSYREKKFIIQESSCYTLIEGYLFKLDHVNEFDDV